MATRLRRGRGRRRIPLQARRRRRAGTTAISSRAPSLGVCRAGCGGLSLIQRKRHPLYCLLSRPARNSTCPATMTGAGSLGKRRGPGMAQTLARPWIDLPEGPPYKPSTHSRHGRTVPGRIAGSGGADWCCSGTAARDAYARRPSRLERASAVLPPAPEWRTYREADLSAEQARAQAPARFPRPHGDRRRPQRHSAAPRQGPQAALGLRPCVPCPAGAPCAAECRTRTAGSSQGVAM